MKKLFIIILLFALILTGCEKSPENKTETTELDLDIIESTGPTEPTEPTEPATEIELPYFEQLAFDILESIKNGDYKKVAEYMRATDENAYKFIQDMTVDSYEIVEEGAASDYDGGIKYIKINFNISKSDNEYFSVGENYWDLYLGGLYPVILFRPSNEKNWDYIKGFNDDKDYNFCYCFSHYFGIFKTTTEFNAALSDESYYFGYAEGSILFYARTSPDNPDIFYLDKLEDYLLKTTGITGIKYTDYMYNKEDNTVTPDGHGGVWLYWIPVSKEQDENTKVFTRYTVVIDYYADTAMLVVAKTMKYTYTVNGDGTYKMLATELIYDSGLSVQKGTI